MSQHDREYEVESYPSVTLVRITERACLVRMKDGTERWVPESVIHDDSEIHRGSPEGEIGSLVIFEWFAVKNGW